MRKRIGEKGAEDPYRFLIVFIVHLAVLSVVAVLTSFIWITRSPTFGVVGLAVVPFMLAHYAMCLAGALVYLIGTAHFGRPREALVTAIVLMVVTAIWLRYITF